MESNNNSVFVRVQLNLLKVYTLSIAQLNNLHCYTVVQDKKCFKHLKVLNAIVHTLCRDNKNMRSLKAQRQYFHTNRSLHPRDLCTVYYLHQTKLYSQMMILEKCGEKVGHALKESRKVVVSVQRRHRNIKREKCLNERALRLLSSWVCKVRPAIIVAFFVL